VAANLLIGGQQPVLLGNDNFTAAPSGTFKTKDGYINIAANKQEQWEALCDVLGVAELKTDPRFQKRDARKKNRKALTPLLEARLAECPTAVWVERLNARDVPSGAILSLEAALSQPQVVHRHVLEEIAVAGVGPVRLFGLTAKFSRAPGAVTAAPPRLGADTDAVLGALGIGAEERAALRAKGVVS
jgi:formyl-CoA transferase